MNCMKCWQIKKYCHIKNKGICSYVQYALLIGRSLLTSGGNFGDTLAHLSQSNKAYLTNILDYLVDLNKENAISIWFKKTSSETVYPIVCYWWVTQ